MSEPDPSAELSELRAEIDRIDRELLAKLRQRMHLVERVASAKIEKAYAFRDQTREEQNLQRVRHAAAEMGLDTHEIERLYRLIMEMSIAHQQAHIRTLDTTPMRVAYQGVEGSFSHLTAQRHYAGAKGGILLTGCETFREAAAGVLDGSEDFALLPIENSTAGSINETYDLLAEGGLTITAEVVSEVSHCLLALQGVRKEELEVVLSHPQALLQCEEYLRNSPYLRPQIEFDTAGAAREVKNGNDRTVGAIASESAARVFGLEILERNIQTVSSNYTRFVEVAREAAPCPPDRPCKTSLLMATGHRPGDLGGVLTEFAKRGINLTKLESRPRPDHPFQYRFYLDIEGHAASVPVVEALKAIEPLTAEVNILGTYPRDQTALGAGPTNQGSAAVTPAPPEHRQS